MRQRSTKCSFDNRLDLTHRALGLHTTISRVQGGNLKSKKEIRIASLFKDAAPEFLRMIVVHELAHFKESDHNKAFDKLCDYMMPGYHQVEFDPAVCLPRIATCRASPDRTRRLTMDVSKTKSSFYRRLYVAYLIDSGLASSVPALTDVTGMPRRTAQDTIAALAHLDIVCEFEQEDGAATHAGHYRIRDWGAIDRG